MSLMKDEALEYITKWRNGRTVILWGDCNFSRELQDFLKSNTIPSMIVDSNMELCDEKMVFGKEKLKELGPAKAYVVVPLRFSKSIKNEITSLGFVKTVDYYYKADSVIVDDKGQYKDSYGNVRNGQRINVYFGGADSTVAIDELNKNSAVKVEMGSDSELKIGKNVTLNTNIKIGDSAKLIIEDDVQICLLDGIIVKEGAVVHIGKKFVARYGIHIIACQNAELDIKSMCEFKGDVIFVDSKASLTIGDESNFGFHDMIMLGPSTKIMIGKQFLASWNVSIISNDGHAYFDLNDGSRINEVGKEKPIIIEDHVWIGANVTIIKGACIGAGSFIGANSLVNSSLANNIVAAGSPAKIIRKNIAWCKSFYAKDIIECGEENIRMTDDCN